MAKRLLGQETEYARSVASGLGPHLSNGSIRLSSRFGRLYIDCGAHPEFTFPECDDGRSQESLDAIRGEGGQ
jgi:hypothetical protein